MHPLVSRPGKSKAHPSGSQNCSVHHSLALVLSSFPRMVSRSRRIQRGCTWCSMSAMAGYKSTFLAFNSALARDPCSRFHGVSCPPTRLTIRDILTRRYLQATTTASKTHIPRTPDYSSPSAVSPKAVKPPFNQRPGAQAKANSRTTAVRLSRQLPRPGVGPRASKRPNERFDYFNSSLLLFPFLCPAGAGECAMISLLLVFSF